MHTYVHVGEGLYQCTTSYIDFPKLTDRDINWEGQGNILLETHAHNYIRTCVPGEVNLSVPLCAFPNAVMIGRHTAAWQLLPLV